MLLVLVIFDSLVMEVLCLLNVDFSFIAGQVTLIRHSETKVLQDIINV